MAQGRRGTPRRRRRSRRKNGFVYRLLSFIIICVVLVMASIVFFKANVIEITGCQRYTQEEIAQAAGVSKGDNLFLLNKFSMANRIFKQLPYVDEVQISRRLPDTLEIQVTECVAAAVIEQDGNVWLIDKKGKILENIKESDAAQYTKVTGPKLLAPSVGSVLAYSEENRLQQTQLIQFLQALSDRQMLAKSQTVDISGESDILLGYDNRFTVRIPETADYGYKLDYLQKVVEQLTDTEHGTIDLSGEAAYFIPG